MDSPAPVSGIPHVNTPSPLTELFPGPGEGEGIVPAVTAGGSLLSRAEEGGGSVRVHGWCRPGLGCVPVVMPSGGGGWEGNSPRGKSHFAGGTRPDAHDGEAIAGQDTWLLSPAAGSGSQQEPRIGETALDRGGS